MKETQAVRELILPAESITLLAYSKEAFAKSDTAGLCLYLRDLTHSVSRALNPRYDAPDLTVMHRQRTKTAVAKYDWWLKERKARLHLDFTQQYYYGWERHIADYTHELAHHADVWVFDLRKSRHTKEFYMRATLLALKLLSFR